MEELLAQGEERQRRRLHDELARVGKTVPGIRQFGALPEHPGGAKRSRHSALKPGTDHVVPGWGRGRADCSPEHRVRRSNRQPTICPNDCSLDRGRAGRLMFDPGRGGHDVTPPQSAVLGLGRGTWALNTLYGSRGCTSAALSGYLSLPPCFSSRWP